MLYRMGALLLLAAMLCGLCGAVAPLPADETGVMAVVPVIRNAVPHYSPDGKWIAFLRGGNPAAGGELWVMDAAGQELRALLPVNQDPPLQVIDFQWNADSRSLICQLKYRHPRIGEFYTLTQLGLDGQLAPDLPQAPPRSTLPISYVIIPNGDRFVWIGGEGSYYRRDVTRNLATYNRVPTTPSLEDYTCQDASWGVDGQLYCTLTPNNQDKTIEPRIYALDPAKGTLALVTEKPLGEHAPALSPDGAWLAYLHGDSLAVREQATGKYNGFMDGVTGYRWLPDGRLLILSEIMVLTTPDGMMVDPGMHVWPRDVRQIRQSFYYVTRPATGTKGLVLTYNTPRSAHFVFDAIQNALPANATYTTVSLASPADPLFAFSEQLPDISPDGTRLVYTVDGALYLMKLPDAEGDAG